MQVRGLGRGLLWTQRGLQEFEVIVSGLKLKLATGSLNLFLLFLGGCGGTLDGAQK